MFAVVRTGGKQYRVHPGDKIVVEKVDGNAGDKITLGDVLLAGDGGSLKSTDGLKVAAEIVAQAKGDKVTVFKKRRRHNYRRKQGHRQLHTILRIVAIGDVKAEKAAKQDKSESKAAAPAKGKAKSPEAEAQQAATEAQAPSVATPNPAPEDEAKANPAQAEPDAGEKPAKAAKPKKAAPAKASTSNAAPAKAAAKKKAK